MKPPIVSIGTPVYNGADFIAESIESVLSQTFTDFELIVSDNCSTDNTAEIVRGFKDPRIVYHRNARNLGLVGNANKCIELSRGRYVGIFHHDDVMLPQNLELKVRLLDENPKVGLVFSNTYWIDPQGRVLNEWLEFSRKDFVAEGRALFRDYIRWMPKGALVFIGSVLARRECYDRVGLFREDLPHTNDSEMWMRMLLFYDAACLGQPLVKWRQHPKSCSHDWNAAFAWLEEHQRAVKIIFDRYDREIADEALREEVAINFFDEGIRQGLAACWRDDYPLARRYLEFSRGLMPKIPRRPEYFELAIRIMLGRRPMNLLRKLKQSWAEAVRHG